MILPFMKKQHENNCAQFTDKLHFFTVCKYNHITGNIGKRNKFPVMEWISGTAHTLKEEENGIKTKIKSK